MSEIAEKIIVFFGTIFVSSLCIGLTAFIWNIMYREWKDKRR